MKAVELMLMDPVEGLGGPGDVVKVAAGYARNFLVPRGLAVAATDDNKRQVAAKREEYQKYLAQRAAEMQALAERLGKLEITTIEKTDNRGNLYGSVNQARVVALLAAEGYELVEKQVRLGQPIKRIGDYVIPLNLGDEVTTQIKVTVGTVTEIVEPEPEPEPVPEEAEGEGEGEGEAEAEGQEK